MRHKFVIILSFFMLGLQAQEFDLPDLSNYQHNWLLLNPGFAGSRNALSASMFSRYKPGEAGGPIYNQLSVHSPTKREAVAWGMYVYQKKESVDGILSQGNALKKENSLFFTYAYRTRIRGGRLSMGLSAGISQSSLNPQNMSIFHPNDPVFGGGNLENETSYLPNAGFGMLYYKDIRQEDSYFMALSVPRFLSLGGKREIIHDFMQYTPIFSGGYEYVASKNFTLNPSFYSQYYMTGNLRYAVSLDLGFFDQKLWFGAIYKSGKMMSYNFNLEIGPKILLGYSMDMSLAPTQTYFNMTHEIVLRFENRRKVQTNLPFSY